jgi:hypothetical protein
LRDPLRHIFVKQTPITIRHPVLQSLLNCKIAQPVPDFVDLCGGDRPEFVCRRTVIGVKSKLWRSLVYPKALALLSPHGTKWHPN